MPVQHISTLRCMSKDAAQDRVRAVANFGATVGGT